MGSGLNGVVATIAVVGTDVYVGGYFSATGDEGTSLGRIAIWDTLTSTWESIPNDFSNPVYVIKSVGPRVYFGGNFYNAGPSSNLNYIAYLEGGSWHALGDGLNGEVYDIEVVGESIYTAGAASNLGGDTTCDSLARWDGSDWLPVACGLEDDYVNDIAILGDEIYAGGWITDAGGITEADYIAHWTGSEWEALGTGLNNFVAAQGLWLEGSKLYVSGGFTTAGGVSTANYVAYWDITESDPQWNGLLGLPAQGAVQTVKVVGTRIYIGGNFFDLGGNSDADRIAYWEDGQWHALGKGLNNSVKEIEVVGSDIYVGGTFTATSDGVTTLNRIARWMAVPGTRSATVFQTSMSMSIRLPSAVPRYTWVVSSLNISAQRKAPFIMLPCGMAAAGTIL